MMRQLEREIETEYGIDCSVAGARAWARISRIGHVSERAPRIQTAGLYVGICRRIDPTLSGIDGRIIACGWCHYSPTEWLGRGRDQEQAHAPIDAFVDYWNKTQKRPGTAGSSYNSEPDDVFALWRAGVPVRDARRLGRDAWRACVGASPTRRVKWELVRRAIRHVRATERASAREHQYSRYDHPLTGKAWAALGRVSVEMQEAILAEIARMPRAVILPNGATRALHASELPWEAAAEVQRQLLADTSGRLRVAWARGKRRDAMLARRAALLDETRRGIEHREAPAYNLEPHHRSDAARWLCPTYPRVSLDQAARLCRGESPVQLSDGQLTRQEAHAWLLQCPDASPLEYLSSRLPHCPAVRSISAVRWLLSVHARGQWSALTRDRNFIGPGGQRILARFLDRVDEIQDEDLDRGPTTGVVRAFEHAATRAGAAWVEQFRADYRVLAPLPAGWRLYPCMQHLCTPASLVREGQEMRHCVGGYVPAVERGQSVILAIRVLGHRSTVELSRDGSVLQHRGPNNESPHPLCEAVLSRFFARIGARRRAA